MQAWDNFVAAQEAEFGAETVLKWLKSLKILRFDACNLYLEAKDAFQAMWFEEHIRFKVQTKLFNNNKKKIKVHLAVANSTPGNSGGKNKKKVKNAQPIPTFSLALDQLDPYCTFEKFIVSDPNLLTHRVLSTISARSQDNDASHHDLASFNPIYIHGGAGTGKTHLLMAAAFSLQQNGFNVIYSRAETFTDHVVSAIRAGEMSIFRQAYRNSDVLIIDDVHVFSRKGATQEEFFHTFNTLHVAGKQIILSANCSPGELQLIEPRLISRFEWGIVLNLEPPTREELTRIIQQKAESLQFAVNQKIIEFLAHTFSTCKSISRALEALVLRCHFNEQQGKNLQGGLTIPIVKQLLSDLILEEEQSALTTKGIIQSTAEFFGIRPDDILGKAQTRDCVLPRQIAMHLCRTLLKMPYVKIGDFFEKDHSTVMSSVKLIQKGIDSDDSEIASNYRAILKNLKNENRE